MVFFFSTGRLAVPEEWSWLSRRLSPYKSLLRDFYRAHPDKCTKVYKVYETVSMVERSFCKFKNVDTDMNEKV